MHTHILHTHTNSGRAGMEEDEEKVKKKKRRRKKKTKKKGGEIKRREEVKEFEAIVHARERASACLLHPKRTRRRKKPIWEHEHEHPVTSPLATFSP